MTEPGTTAPGTSEITTRKVRHIDACLMPYSQYQGVSTGLSAVRAIKASMSASYHMLRAPAAPAPIRMHRIATAATQGWTVPGANVRPTNAVNTTSDITRGFSSCR